MNDLKKALEVSFEQRSEKELLSAELPEEHKFSERHNSKMKDFIYSRRSVSYRWFGTKKRCALSIAVICLSIITLTACTVAVRKPVRNFIVSVFDGHYKVDFNSGDSSNEIEDISQCEKITETYELTVIPEGYVKESTQSGQTYVCTYYSKNGKKMFFGQYPDGIYRDVYLNGNSNPESVYDENGQEYLIADVEEGICVLWNKGDYILHLTGNFTKEEALELCKSAKIVKN